MQVLHTYTSWYVFIYTRVHYILLSQPTLLVVYSREKTLPPFLRRLFYLPVDTTSSFAPHEDLPVSLSRSLAFIKYKQFHAFHLTPERFAEHIFTTWHSGFCQLSASRYFTDSSFVGCVIPDTAQNKQLFTHQRLQTLFISRLDRISLRIKSTIEDEYSNKVIYASLMIKRKREKDIKINNRHKF